MLVTQKIPESALFVTNHTKEIYHLRAQKFYSKTSHFEFCKKILLNF